MFDALGVLAFVFENPRQLRQGEPRRRRERNHNRASRAVLRHFGAASRADRRSYENDAFGLPHLASAEARPNKPNEVRSFVPRAVVELKTRLGHGSSSTSRRACSARSPDVRACASHASWWPSSGPSCSDSTSPYGSPRRDA